MTSMSMLWNVIYDICVYIKYNARIASVVGEMEKNSFLVKWSFKFSVHLLTTYLNEKCWMKKKKCKDDMTLMAFFFATLNRVVY